MSIFPQPMPDKSLVNWDIRGARAKYIEKEVKLYEREQKSPPIPQKQSSDYIVNTRHGPNPNVIRANQPNLEVHLPQGQSAFDLGGKRHFMQNQGEIKEKRSLENPFNLPSNYEFTQPYYPRSLNVKDIDGTIPGTLASKVVKNKEQAQKIIQQEKNELQILKEQQKNPYEKYQDALDRFKNEMNVGNVDFRDRHHYIENTDNPYAPVDYPRYSQGNQQNYNNQDSVNERERYQPKREQNVAQRDSNNDEEKYKPRQFRDDNNRPQQQDSYGTSAQEQSVDKAKKDFEYYQEYLREKELEKGQQQQQGKQQYSNRISQENENERRYIEQSNEQKDNDYRSIQTREIQLVKGGNERRRQSPPEHEQQQHSYIENQRQKDNQSSYLKETEQREQYKDPNSRQIYRQPSPEIDYKRNGVISSYKSQPNLLKLNHQSEIISHTMNNISPQITKQTLAPNLNIEGYVGHGKGQRLNPTSMSYVGTELANKNITIGHNILGNQIYVKEKSKQQLQKDPLNYTHTQLNYQKFEKYPGELLDILKAQGKAPTNENLFQLQYERANAPKSTMGSILKYPVNVYEKGEANLDHFKKESNPLPQYKEFNADSFMPRRDSVSNQQMEEYNSQIQQNYAAPYGAPFSYNPNEYKKKAMVALNHSKQLEKIEQQIDNADKNINTIQRGSPELQQPHIKKTLHSNRYDELGRQFQAEEEEKIRNRLQYQKYLESKPFQENFAGLGSYGEYVKSKGQEQKSSPSMEFIQQYGAKALRNISNVRIC